MMRRVMLFLIGLTWLSVGTSVMADTITSPPLRNDRGLLDLNIKTPDVVRKYGYPVETHTVTTDDGYLLTVHRIPGSPRAPSSGVKTPVFLMHALIMASDVWVARGPEIGLGFLLADQGYDVWMGNARGTVYSRNHTSLSPNDKEFWDFSWHEMGVYDLPAVIDHILLTTNHQQLCYVGYSMGTTMFFVLTTMRPEYNKKIRRMVALAPVAFDGQTSSVFETALRIISGSNLSGLFPRTKDAMRFINFLCRDGQILQTICMAIYYSILGYNPKELNTSLLPLYMSRMSSGTSSATFEHFVHVYKTDRFQLMDRGAKTRGYIAQMPEYNLSLTTVPIAIIYAPNDAIVRPKGVLKLVEHLPNVVRIIRVADEEASHAVFAFANNAKNLVYDHIITLLQTDELWTVSPSLLHT